MNFTKNKQNSIQSKAWGEKAKFKPTKNFQVNVNLWSVNFLQLGKYRTL